MLRIVWVLCMLLGQGARPFQGDRSVFLAADVPEIEAGQTVTLQWYLFGDFEQLDHVTLEMSHPWLTSLPQTFPNLPIQGSLSVTVPQEYYDWVTFRVYPEKANGERYRIDYDTIYAQVDVKVIDGVEVIKFRADPNPSPRQSGVLVSWDVAGLDPETDTIRLGYYNNDGLYVQTDPYPPVGTAVIEIPPYNTSTFDIFLAAPQVMTDNQITVEVVCPFGTYLSPVCPFTLDEVTLTYQRFQYGTMLYWAGQILVVYDNGGFNLIQSDDNWEPDLSLVPPHGYYLADNLFRPVWSGLHEMLGWAEDPALSYDTVLETYPDMSGRHRTTSMIFELPNGNLIDANVMSYYWTAVD